MQHNHKLALSDARDFVHAERKGLLLPLHAPKTRN